jgi:hypothetical protein
LATPHGSLSSVGNRFGLTKTLVGTKVGTTVGSTISVGAGPKVSITTGLTISPFPKNPNQPNIAIIIASTYLFYFILVFYSYLLPL